MMDLSPCEYSNVTDEGAVLLTQALAWNPPRGHPDWCNTQRAPWLRLTLRTGTGRTGFKNAPVSCNCSRNALAKHLRKLAALKQEGKA